MAKVSVKSMSPEERREHMREIGRRGGLKGGAVVLMNGDRPDFLKAMDYILVFLSGFSVCAVVGGTLWFLRECERAKAFKALRDENEFLRARDRRHRHVLAYVRDGIGEIRNSLGGRVALPAPASPMAVRPEVNMQHARKLITARLTGPLNGGPGFYQGGNDGASLCKSTFRPGA